ncbi:MAG: cyclic nucleotide-binding domain-containing protein [Desulfobacterales bacterium]|nr:cyclic nucleotide-binding domain-containing protein [Desulfobacterales bacterium]
MNWLPGKNDTCTTCEYQENLDLLRHIYFFSGIPLDALKLFAYLCTRESFKPDDYLFHQNDPAGRAFYFISGQARLTFHSDGRELVIRDYKVGDFLGGLTLMGNIRRLFSLTALTETTCLIMSRNKFTKALENFPGLLPIVTNVLIDELVRWEERFLDSSLEKCAECMRKVGVSLI